MITAMVFAANVFVFHRADREDRTRIPDLINKTMLFYLSTFVHEGVKSVSYFLGSEE